MDSELVIWTGKPSLRFHVQDRCPHTKPPRRTREQMKRYKRMTKAEAESRGLELCNGCAVRIAKGEYV